VDRIRFENRLSYIQYDYLNFRRFKPFAMAIGCHGIVSPPKEQEMVGRQRETFHEELVQYNCANLALLVSRPVEAKNETNKYYWRHYGPLQEVKTTGGKAKVKNTNGKPRKAGKKAAASPRTSARTRPSP
jgi:hypothetical protein